jgi:penicillin-binding protein 1A
MWWDNPQAKKPFYRRWWFTCILVLAGLLAVAGLVAGVWWLYFKHEYETKAAAFDLSKLEEMESASVIYDRNDAVMGKIFIQNRDPVAWEDFPEDLRKAVVAAEDNRFWQHHGADYYGMARAWVRNRQAGRVKQGASTLTQQLARNTFPEQLPSSARTYERKFLEIFVARRIEDQYPKEKIMEMYLNRVYFGSGFYGAETASRGYFGKSARNLNLSECATLAGLLKNPNSLSPWSNRKACLDARNFVLGRMLELKMITREIHDETTGEDLLVKNRRTRRGESYALDLIRQQVEKTVGADKANSDGYRIYTTIDSDLQKTAQESLQRQLLETEKHDGFNHQTYAQFDAIYRQRMKKNADADPDAVAAAMPSPDYLQGSLVAIDNATGGLLALVGGRDFYHSQFDRALMARRPAGTAFKPFVYAAAFEKGVFPGTLVQDSIMDNRQVMIGGTTGILGEWGPERIDNKYEGYITARDALVKSKNSATVRLGMLTGLDRVTALAKAAGIASPLRQFPATYLGSSEVTLMELTMAYSIFPNDGWKPSRPYIIKRIEEKDGRAVYQERPQRKPVIKETTAYEVSSCLSDVLERGTGDKAFSKYGLKKVPVAGKTGTAYNFTDVWFVGYSSEITCGVWAGFDKPQPIYRGAFSNDIALPIWVDVMNSTFAKYKPRETEMPRGLSKYKICTTTGLLATDKCFETLVDKATGLTVQHPTTYFEIATADQVPKEYCVHGEAPKSLTLPVANTPAGEPAIPRAELATDVTAVKPVNISGQTVVGQDDPYNSVKQKTAPIENTDAAPGANGQSKEEVEVRPAQPVRPLDEPMPESTIKVDAPPALDF